MPKTAKTGRRHVFADLLTRVGLVCISLALALALTTFWPVILEELGYNAKRIVRIQNEITPIDTEFGIVIPKIGANAKVIPNVDPYNSRIYQRALTKGVAHAKGTSVPEEGGNIFLFSHSSVNFYEASRYNSVFYLLSKLQKNDEIHLYYQGNKYSYAVSDTRIVAATDVQYLQSSIGETLTLMTCWPPGTTYKRLLVIAKRLP